MKWHGDNCLCWSKFHTTSEFRGSSTSIKRTKKNRGTKDKLLSTIGLISFSLTLSSLSLSHLNSISVSISPCSFSPKTEIEAANYVAPCIPFLILIRKNPKISNTYLVTICISELKKIFLHLTGYTWHVTGDTWQVTHVTWQMTHDT